MDNVMDERFTAREIDAIKAEADLDIISPAISSDEQARYIREKLTANVGLRFFKRKYGVLLEALHLAKMELQAANNELDVLRESLTCQTRYGNTLQDTIDLQTSKLQAQNRIIENLEKNLADGAHERASLNDVLENTLKQMRRLADAGLNVATQLDSLRFALNRRSVWIWLLVTSNILLGIYTAVKHLT